MRFKPLLSVFAVLVLSGLVPPQCLGRSAEVYEPGLRPDPFVDPTAMFNKGPEPVRLPGLAGMLIDETALLGVTLFGGEAIAILQGSDGMGYSAREGEALWDGRIAAIDFERAVVIFDKKNPDPEGSERVLRIERKLVP